MPLFNNYLVDQLLVPVISLFFLVSGVVGVAIGVGLIVSSGRMFRLFGTMNRWVSAQKGLEPMEVPHDIGRAVHKYRRWFGAVFVVAAGFSAFILVGRVDDAEVVSALGGKTSPIIVAWIVESLRWFLVLGSVLAVVIGVMLGLSPSALTALETRVDRWYSHRQIDKGADKMHLALDRWVESFPRTAGWSIAVGAVVVLIVAAVVLLRHH